VYIYIYPINRLIKSFFFFLTVDRPDLPLEYEENAWLRLERAIHAIQQNQPSPESLEVLYQVRFRSNLFRNKKKLIMLSSCARTFVSMIKRNDYTNDCIKSVINIFKFNSNCLPGIQMLLHGIFFFLLLNNTI
jgi:hypothetical protein